MPTSPSVRIRIYLDGDGTIYPDLQLYKGLCDPIPELNYFPTIAAPQLEEHFVRVQREIKARGEEYAGNDVVNGELCRMAKPNGPLAGLNNRILAEVGRRHIRLFDGVVDFMHDARQVVESLSEGRVTVDFVITTANLREGVLASELGKLMEGDRPLVADITGQSFREENGVLVYAQRAFSGESKADRLLTDVRSGIVDEKNTIVIADGLTDRMIFAANSGLNVLVNSYTDPDRVAEMLAFTRQSQLDTAKGRNAGSIHGPLPNDWRRTDGGRSGTLYSTVMGHLKHLTRSITQDLDGRRRMEPPTRLGTYADERDHDLAHALARTTTARTVFASEPVRVSGLASAPAISGEVQEFIRAAARFDVFAAVDPTSARELISTGTVRKSLKLVIPHRADNDDALRQMLGELTDTSGADIELPRDGGARMTYLTKFGALQLRRVAMAHEVALYALPADVNNGTYPALRINGYSVPMAAPVNEFRRNVPHSAAVQLG